MVSIILHISMFPWEWTAVSAVAKGSMHWNHVASFLASLQVFLDLDSQSDSREKLPQMRMDPNMSKAINHDMFQCLPICPPIFPWFFPIVPWFSHGILPLWWFFFSGRLPWTNSESTGRTHRGLQSLQRFHRRWSQGFVTMVRYAHTMYVYEYIHTHVHVHVYVYVTCICICIYLCFMYTYLPNYIPTYLHTYLPTYIPTYIHTSICIYIYMCIYIYIHACIQTHMYIYM